MFPAADANESASLKWFSQVARSPAGITAHEVSTQLLHLSLQGHSVLQLQERVTQLLSIKHLKPSLTSLTRPSSCTKEGKSSSVPLGSLSNISRRWAGFVPNDQLLATFLRRYVRISRTRNAMIGRKHVTEQRYFCPP